VSGPATGSLAIHIARAAGSQTGCGRAEGRAGSGRSRGSRGISGNKVSIRDGDKREENRGDLHIKEGWWVFIIRKDGGLKEYKKL